ncbi:MAG: hypothetical protein BWY82_02845 [Verrucomicrobia bacterium ADurb.Bin474]|nr:MAG: hypothetical protein BWY82_02845 [Verrucomicrobia bacterium ADurb.Bin474]
MRDQIRVGDQYARRIRMGFEDRHRLAGLDEKRLIIFQLAQSIQNSIESLPAASGFSLTSIDNQIHWTFSHFGVQIVLDHAVGGFCKPGFAR